jgi:hypothetical protein
MESLYIYIYKNMKRQIRKETRTVLEGGQLCQNVRCNVVLCCITLAFKTLHAAMLYYAA